MAEQVITLCAANNKLFLGIPKDKVKWFQMEMLEYMKDNYNELMCELETEKVLTEELTEKILNAVTEAKEFYLG